MCKYRDASSDICEELFRNLRFYQFFAIYRSRRQNFSRRIDNHRRTAKRHAVIGAHAIRNDQISLIFDRASEGEDSQMFRAHYRPGGRVHDHVCAMLYHKRSHHFRKTQVVTNAEPYREIVDLGADEFISGRKTNPFIEWRRSHEMDLSILGNRFAMGVDLHLSIKNRIAFAIRNASNDRD